MASEQSNGQSNGVESHDDDLLDFEKQIAALEEQKTEKPVQAEEKPPQKRVCSFLMDAFHYRIRPNRRIGSMSSAEAPGTCEYGPEV